MKRVTVLFLLSLAMVVAWPSAALAEQWPAEREVCGGSAAERGSGQMDARGWSYLACSRNAAGNPYHYIRIADASGVVRQLVELNFAGTGTTLNQASDVAPSPDGVHLYVIHYDSRTPYRFSRRPDGTYAVDQGWKLALFPAAGGGEAVYNPRGMFLATDANGDIYMSMGLWSTPLGTDNTVVKYRPDGSFVTRFGRVANWWDPGVAWAAWTGLAVTADGARVFVADLNNSRVHRFDRQADGSYRVELVMGNLPTDPGVQDPNNPELRHGICGTSGKLAAPYDVAMSPAGELFVISATCNGGYGGLPAGTAEVARFGQDGTPRGLVHMSTVSGAKVHGIAIDRQATIHLVQGGVSARPPATWRDGGADAGGGGPMGGTAPASPADVTAPTVSAFSAPPTTTTAAIALSMSAQDDTAVADLRLTEDGVRGEWQPWAASLSHNLAGGVGAHVLTIEARDAAGNVSLPVSVTVQQDAPTVAPPGDRVRPSIVRVAMPAQVRGRRVPVVITARDDRAAVLVRFAGEGGRWGAWQPARGRRLALLSPGLGWKGVFIQVRDAAGNRSRPWFQTVLLAPRGAEWRRGTARVDTIRMGGRAGHADLSRYDGKVDRVSCGAGLDSVLLQPGDVAARDCERVARLVTPAW